MELSTLWGLLLTRVVLVYLLREELVQARSADVRDQVTSIPCGREGVFHCLKRRFCAWLRDEFGTQLLVTNCLGEYPVLWLFGMCCVCDCGLVASATL